MNPVKRQNEPELASLTNQSTINLRYRLKVPKCKEYSKYSSVKNTHTRTVLKAIPFKRTLKGKMSQNSSPPNQSQPATVGSLASAPTLRPIETCHHLPSWARVRRTQSVQPSCVEFSERSPTETPIESVLKPLKCHGSMVSGGLRLCRQLGPHYVERR